jgi:hypothetical protein
LETELQTLKIKLNEMQTDQDLKEKNLNQEMEKAEKELSNVNMSALVKKMLLKKREKAIKKHKSDILDL